MKLRKRGVNFGSIWQYLAVFGSILAVFWQSKTANLNRDEVKAAEQSPLGSF